MAPASRFIAALLGALTLLGCNRADDANRARDAAWQEPGWHYRFDGDDDRGAAIYRFGGKAQVYFIALCDRIPIFTLANGNDDPLAKVYDLTVDDRTWQRPIYRDEHGGGLMIDDPHFADIFARAKHRISFRVGGAPAWEFAPSPMLRRLVAECRQHNQTS